jgi:hypothetical protein
MMEKRGLSGALDCPELQKALEPTLQQYSLVHIHSRGRDLSSSANAAPALAEIMEKLGYQKIDYYETPRGASIITKANELSSMHNPPPLASSTQSSPRCPVAKRERMQSRGWMASWNFTPTSEPWPAPPAPPPSPMPAPACVGTATRTRQARQHRLGRHRYHARRRRPRPRQRLPLHALRRSDGLSDRDCRILHTHGNAAP